MQECKRTPPRKATWGNSCERCYLKNELNLIIERTIDAASHADTRKHAVGIYVTGPASGAEQLQATLYSFISIDLILATFYVSSQIL